MKKVAKVEWLYDSASIPGDADDTMLAKGLRLNLACLRVFDDGSAEILFSESRNEFANEERARDFLVDDEYQDLDDLKEEHGITVGVPLIR